MTPVAAACQTLAVRVLDDADLAEVVSVRGADSPLAGPTSDVRALFDELTRQGWTLYGTKADAAARVWHFKREPGPA
jgi:hypothetical protein